jgi:hypothetical protein
MMSKIGNYIIWCQDTGRVNENGEVDSMEYADEYMETLQYAREHREQVLKEALSEADEDSLYGMMHKLGYLVEKHKELKKN